MADNEDDSGSTRTITATEQQANCTQSGDETPAAAAEQSGQTEETSQTAAGAESGQPGDSLPAGSGAQLTDFLQSCTEEQSILVGTEFTSLSPDLANTTIIYVQPDGSFVEGSGLSAEEQQALLEQLSRQQIVQVSDTEAAQLLQQSQVVKTGPVPSAALDPSQLQQVINQVTKSQQHAQLPQQKPVQVQVQVPQQKQVQVVQQKQVQVLQQKQVQVLQQKTSTPNNASQQLKSVAQQFALQTSGSVQVVQQKSEPVRIQIQVPHKQEAAAFSAPQQQKTVAVNHPQVKLSANGSVSSAQIIHIQPVVGQQGQQFFLQQRPGDPPIQLLLQGPAPVVGSLLPVVHKVPSQTPLVGSTASSAQKPAITPVRVQAPATVKTPPPSIMKAPPLPAAKATSAPLVKAPPNGVTTAGKIPAKAPAVVTAAAPAATTPARPAAAAPPTTAAPPPASSPAVVKEREKKVKKREKKAAKVQTRSGRVSRPPKYKAKDYKFIKTEDLADSHQSDSDDYSDMSVEDEEAARKDGQGAASSSSLVYSHKSRSHRCQTCDKAYIGPGGLNRHYKLNPSHGEPSAESPGHTPRPLRDDSQPQESTAGGARLEEEEEGGGGGRRGGQTRQTCCHGNGQGGGGSSGICRTQGPSSPWPRSTPRARKRQGAWPWAGTWAGPLTGTSPKARRGPHQSARPPRQAPQSAGRHGNHSAAGGEEAGPTAAGKRKQASGAGVAVLVEQCEDEELMDVVLPRLTKVLTLWELLLAKVEGSSAARTRFPDIYREFESLQAQVRQAAQDYIASPQASGVPLEVRNIEVAKFLGILDEVNKMKVVPGASSGSSLTSKNVRYMENSKMLPPSKRFKMENSVQQNGLETSRTGETTVASVTSSMTSSIAPSSSSLTSTVASATSSVTSSLTSSLTPAASTVTSSMTPAASSVTPAAPTVTSSVTPAASTVTSTMTPAASTVTSTVTPAAPTVTSTVTPAASSVTSSVTLAMKPCSVSMSPLDMDQTESKLSTTADSASSSSKMAAAEPPVATVAMTPVTPGDDRTSDVTSQTTTEETRSATKTPQSSPVQTLCQSKSSSANPCETKEVQEGQEIYIQTEGLTVEMAEPGLDRIVIVNGPDGTTMHIQTPEGVPLEAVQALLGIEASNGTKAPQ
ncbi:uncharacterized protein V6R79_024374 [Siganus canaliculatus]